MKNPLKACKICEAPRHLNDFWGAMYPGEVLHLSTICNTCTGKAPVDPLTEAKQLYYSYVESLIMLGFGTRYLICRQERVRRKLDTSLTKKEKVLAHHDIKLTSLEIEVLRYKEWVAKIRRRIARHNGVPPDKPRMARRKWFTGADYVKRKEQLKNGK